MIRLIDVTPENWRLRLNVAKAQEKYVADKTVILARAYAYRNRRSRAFFIYDEEIPIGMGLYYDCPERVSYDISQIFIDERYQGRGYGKAAMQLLLDEMKLDGKYKKVMLCYIAGNDIAQNMYKQLGFVEIGRDEDEIVMEMTLPDAKSESNLWVCIVKKCYVAGKLPQQSRTTIKRTDSTFQQSRLLFVNGFKNRLCHHGAQGRNTRQAQCTHDAAGQQYAAHAGKYTGFEIHIQQAGGQGAGPGAGARQRDAYEEQQCPRQTASGFFFQLFAAFVALLQAESEELTDDRFVSPPFQHFAGEEENKGNGQHVADDGDDVNAPQGQTQAYTYRNGTTQLEQRYHRDKENVQIICQHLETSQCLFLFIQNRLYYTG